MPSPVSILVIEDCDGDFHLLKRAFRAHSEFTLVRAHTIAEGFRELEANEFDLVLLDLSLPDGDGLDAIPEIRKQSSVPVVVLSGQDSEDIAIATVQHGAQDYIEKEQIETSLLLRTIRYAMERQRLVRELEEVKLAAQREHEASRIESATPLAKTPTTAGMFGQQPLSKLNPTLFREFVEHYESLLDLALEQRIFKVEHDFPKQLRDFAAQLGRIAAVPRDLVEIHTAGMSSRTADQKPAKVKVCNEEGRYLLMGLMGHLCSFYRLRCSGLKVASPEAMALRHEDSVSREAVK